VHPCGIPRQGGPTRRDVGEAAGPEKKTSPRAKGAHAGSGPPGLSTWGRPPRICPRTVQGERVEPRGGIQETISAVGRFLPAGLASRTGPPGTNSPRAGVGTPRSGWTNPARLRPSWKGTRRCREQERRGGDQGVAGRSEVPRSGGSRGGGTRVPLHCSCGYGEGSGISWGAGPPAT